MEFCLNQDHAKLMKKFAKKGKRLAYESNMTIYEILKCLDAIPMIDRENKATNDEAEETLINVSENETKTIKYIGGFIGRKLSRKQFLSLETRIFLQQCVTKESQSALYDIVEPLVNVLTILEKKNLELVDLKLRKLYRYPN